MTSTFGVFNALHRPPVVMHPHVHSGQATSKGPVYTRLDASEVAFCGIFA